MNAREVPANDTSSMNTELTVRLAQPVNIEDVRVQVKWSLYFNEITIGRSPDDCRFKPNSYKWELNKNLWAPTINFDCKKAISLKDHKSYMNFTLRTPIWNFPLDNIQLKLDKGSTIFLQTATRGRERFPGVIKNINNRFYVNISSPVKDIKITFNDTLDMKLGEERLSIHKVLEPKENEALRVIYSLPSPLTKRSEINMSISRSHWLIEKISVIKASGELHATCKNTTNPCNDVLAVCNNGTCLCPKHYKEKKWRCLAPHAMPCSPNDGCITANAMCMNRTESDGITRWTCQCKQNETYIEAVDKCSELHRTCNNITNPCKDLLAVCDNGTCLCPKYYKEKKWKCLAPHTNLCSPDDGCITANATCMNRTEPDGITRWTCQCKQGEDYIEADDKCSGSTSSLTIWAAVLSLYLMLIL